MVKFHLIKLSGNKTLCFLSDSEKTTPEKPECKHYLHASYVTSLETPEQSTEETPADSLPEDNCDTESLESEVMEVGQDSSDSDYYFDDADVEDGDDILAYSW